MFIERCCTDSAQALEALKAGAGRIELCRDLPVGGITPEKEEIVRAIATGIPVNVLVRPRGGDFVYTEAEIEEMKETIRFCREAGANGVVIGALKPDGNIDIGTMKALMAEAEGLSVTFHRAFDECSDPEAALEEIISLGCDRLLSSGQAASAYEGRELLAALVKQSAGRIVIMPGAGVTPQNIQKLADATGAVEFHGTRLGTKAE